MRCDDDRYRYIFSARSKFALFYVLFEIEQKVGIDELAWAGHLRERDPSCGATPREAGYFRRANHGVDIRYKPTAEKARLIGKAHLI